jgi:hypothetical protein
VGTKKEQKTLKERKRERKRRRRIEEPLQV